ncbi:MAG: helix-turn-helix transcriptional regulator [Candidatus Thiodiazotropha sp. (ex Ctena orbiculata)]|nr:helix-turn-helix transcriptional regulator [Candidatus Thiodiazotropha taylori]
MKNISDNSVPFRLRAERKRLGGTQAKWADEISVSEKTWRRWESGESPIPSDSLELMINYGFDVNYILTGTQSKTDVLDLDAEQREILALWRRVPLRAKSSLMVLMQQLAPYTDMSDASIEFIDPDSVHSEKEKV